MLWKNRDTLGLKTKIKKRAVDGLPPKKQKAQTRRKVIS
jgi:hypothetical protein